MISFMCVYNENIMIIHFIDDATAVKYALIERIYTLYTYGTLFPTHS